MDSYGGLLAVGGSELEHINCCCQYGFFVIVIYDAYFFAQRDGPAS